MESSTSPRATQANILVADDEPNIRTPMVKALNLMGFHCREAESGEKALELLEETSFDVMLLDIRMPGMDGVEVMHQARQLCPEIMIIILTGHASLESAIAAVKSEAVDYLVKPIGIHQVATVIQRALERRDQEVRPKRLLRTVMDALRQAGGSDDVADLTTGPEPKTQNLESAALETTPPARFLRAGSLTLDLFKRVIVVNGPSPRTIELTTGEEVLMTVLMKTPDQVISCRALVKQAWNYDMTEQQAQSLVRPYISRLRQKLEPTPNAPRIIRNVRGRGYLLSSLFDE